MALLVENVIWNVHLYLKSNLECSSIAKVSLLSKYILTSVL